MNNTLRITQHGHSLREVLDAVASTWNKSYSLPIIDYSSPLVEGRVGSQAHTLDETHFRRFLAESRPLRF